MYTHIHLKNTYTFRKISVILLSSMYRYTYLTNLYYNTYMTIIFSRYIINYYLIKKINLRVFKFIKDGSTKWIENGIYFLLQYFITFLFKLLYLNTFFSWISLFHNQAITEKKRIIQNKVNCYIELMTFYSSTTYDFLAGNQRHLLSINM